MAKFAIVNKISGSLTDICDEEDKFDIYEGPDAELKWCKVPDDTSYEHIMINGVCVHREMKEDLRESATVQRGLAYGDMGSQLDMQYKDSLDGGTRWVDHIARVKSTIPAPSSIPPFVPNPAHIQIEGNAAWDIA